MKVKCLTKDYITQTTPCFFNPHEPPCDMDDFIPFSTFTTTETGVKYSVIVDAEYTVYGIMVHDNIMYYLISFEENQPPDWIPSCLFEVLENSIPYFWGIETSFVNNDEIMFIMSHYKIVNDFKHMIRLIQGNPLDFEEFKQDIMEY